MTRVSKAICLSLAATTIYLASIASHAITVKVRSDYKDCDADGFTVNDHKHGGLGCSHDYSGMPSGARYTFGYRTSLFGSDHTCSDDQTGESSIILTRNTTVTLHKDTLTQAH